MDAMGVVFLEANEEKLSLWIPNEICNGPVGHWHPGLPPNRYIVHDILWKSEEPKKRMGVYLFPVWIDDGFVEAFQTTLPETNSSPLKIDRLNY